MGFRFSQTSASTSSCASPLPSWSSASPALPLPIQSPKQLSALLKLLQSVSLKLELHGMLARTGLELIKSSAAWKTSLEPPTAGIVSALSFPSFHFAHKKQILHSNSL